MCIHLFGKVRALFLTIQIFLINFSIFFIHAFLYTPNTHVICYRAFYFNDVRFLCRFVLSIFYHKITANPCHFSHQSELWVEISRFFSVFVIHWISIFYEATRIMTPSKYPILTFFVWHLSFVEAPFSRNKCGIYEK